MRIGLGLLRVIVGGLFLGHGLQKLAGWFGGNGLRRTAESFESMGLRPGVAHAATAAAGETAGGAMLAAGLLTPLGAAMLSASQITAIRKVHGANGPWVSDRGYEYNLVLLAAVFALSAEGPGRPSLDEALGTRRTGIGWALAQLAAGAAASSVAIGIAERQAPQAAVREESESGPGPESEARAQPQAGAEAEVQSEAGSESEVPARVGAGSEADV